MTLHKVIMPKMGMYTDDIRLVEWLKEEGAAVELGELLFTLETDKITSDVEADAAGWIHRLVEADELVPIGGQVAVIAETKEEYEQSRSMPAPAEPTGRSASDEPPPPAARGLTPLAARRPLVSPRARALIARHGLTLEDVAGLTGSGPGGRVTDKDVEAFLAGAEPPPGTPRVAERISLRGRRRTIAERMRESLLSAAQLTSVLEIDVSPVVAWRRERQPAPGYTAVFLKLVAAALRSFPLLNARVAGDEIEVMADVNVGFAVHAESGVIVPVVHGADTLSLADAGRRVEDLTARARTGRLSPADVEGGTFTLSNSGQFAVDLTTAILNPPQTGILWIGRIRERAVVVAGTVAARPTVQACLTFDHRVVDGAPAAEFLGELERLVESFPGCLE